VGVTWRGCNDRTWSGLRVAQIEVPPGSPLSWLAFQGTADDARALLIKVSSTVVTVIALVLGLTVVALQLSSTQFSPRLQRVRAAVKALRIKINSKAAAAVEGA
jgi:uncharacterized membrane protein